MNNFDHQIPVSNGGSLDILEQGPKDGIPIIYLHGAPGSNKDHARHETFYQAQGIRMISVNRPGTGFSKTGSDWSALAFTYDLKLLMDNMKIKKAAIIGFSAGGLYACAFAKRFPEHVSRLGLVASVGPFDRPSLYKRLTEATQIFYEGAKHDPDGLLQQLSGIKTADAMLELLLSLVSVPDRQILTTSETRKTMLCSFADVLQQGLGSFIKEVYNIASPWGFSATEITVETHLWHGNADNNIPIECSEYLAEQIPNAKATYLEGAGHYFSFAQWPEIVQAILEN